MEVTPAPKRRIIDVRRRREVLRRIARSSSYDPILNEFAEMAGECEQWIAADLPGALRQGRRIISLWNKRCRRLHGMRSASRYSAGPTVSGRKRGGCHATSFQRSRSREQSHTPRLSTRTSSSSRSSSNDPGDGASDGPSSCGRAS